MERNIIHNRDFLANGLPDHCAQLIVADPPYYDIKGEFDTIWPDAEAYFRDAVAWMTECERVLATNGTIVWYCSVHRLGRTLVEMERLFHVLNVCTIVKENGIQAKFASAEAQRSFFTNDERFIVAESNSSAGAEEAAGLLAKNRWKYEQGMAHTRAVEPVIDYLIGELTKSGMSVSDVDRALQTSMGGHWFSKSSQFALPTREAYGRLQELFRGRVPDLLARPYDDLRAEYDRLKGDKDTGYEALRRPFRMEGRQSDVFTIRVDSGIGARLGHPTVKNTPLTGTLIRTLSREGDLVVVPFAGSGTECSVAAALGRDFIGYEISERYTRIATARSSEVQGEIFR